MPPVDCENPVRGQSFGSTYPLTEFVRERPDDASCLDLLWRARFAADGHHAYCPKCDRERKFHRVRSRPSYACDSCGYHLRPLAGTIFHKSSTPLHLWFYAMYLMASTRCGVSAKHLERELGVTYKTAWRMFNLIRNKLMADDGDMRSDEALRWTGTLTAGSIADRGYDLRLGGAGFAVPFPGCNTFAKKPSTSPRVGTGTSIGS